MRSPRTFALVLAALALAGGFVWIATRPPVPRLDQPSPGHFHVRPIADRDALRALGPELPWKQTGYEIALPSEGSVRIELTDRSRALWTQTKKHPAGILRLSMGIRRVDAKIVKREHSKQFDAEAARLQKGGLARDFLAWRAVWSFQPAAAKAPEARGEIESMVPRESAPPMRAEYGSGRLWSDNALGFQVRAAGERLRLQDWVSLPRIFKPFEHRFETLPVDLELEGKKVPVAEAPDPVYRVAITWTPKEGR